MTKDTTKAAAVAADILLFEDWFDPIEDAVRARVRGFIETMLEEELDAALSRPRYGRRKADDDDAPPPVIGCRHGHRERTLTGTFGKTRIAVPRARLVREDGKTHEWRSASLRAYQRRTKAAEALAALWQDVAVQRCTVYKHRNAPERLHEEISNDYKDMIYAKTKSEVEEKRKAFIRKWRLKCRAVAYSLEEAGDKLFTFTRFPPSQWKSIRTSNAIERLHEEFKRRIKTQTVLPCAETAAMLFWALLASGQSPCERSTIIDPAA
jgi:transposase-like protein